MMIEFLKRIQELDNEMKTFLGVMVVVTFIAACVFIGSIFDIIRLHIKRKYPNSKDGE
jgi:hypothetical protein